MKLKEIILGSNWEAIRKTFLHNYPDQEKSIIGYESVFKKLRSKAPVNSKMELVCEKAVPILKDDEPFFEVYGIDGTKREDGELERFSLSLAPWSKWLGTSLSERTLNKYTKEEIISHCLFDMTFHGFSEAEMRKVRKKLDKQIKDMESQVRYVIVSNFLSDTKWRHYFNVANETWCDEIDTATIFKRKKYAAAILKKLNKGKDKSNIIAKITTKGKKRKVLKYYK